MSRISRVLVVIASGLVVLMFLFPLWEIGLIAPQYPEGLSMQIWLYKITGDLKTINILNHYIGMMPIEPEGLAELRLFPYIFGGLAILGPLVALINKRWVLHVATACVFATALLSLVDFYQWEYRYGHDLSEDAPMKFEESYDLPLIGTKQITSVMASSFPEEGGYAFMGVVFLYTASSLLNLKKKRR